MPTPIYLATVLLEINRWGSREPTLKVSEWAQRITDAGFDGVELWENHLLKADKAEWDALKQTGLPVPILNTYCDFDDDSADARSASAELARDFNVDAVKFNFGNKTELEDQYIANLLAWKDQLPVGCRLLCECHPYTVLEDLDNAQRILEPILSEIEIIVHGFGGDTPDDLLKRIELFGSRITHVHAVLTDKSSAPDRIEILNDAGFDGSYTIEFCHGVREGEKNIGVLLETAAEDMNYLRKELS